MNYLNEYDAVVIGAGPNGLAAAICAAKAGWSVLVLEANEEPGGCVRSAELTLPGIIHDVFSSFYPLGNSPVLKSFQLENFGLRWCRADIATANPTPDGQAAFIGRTTDDTAQGLELLTPNEGRAWRDFMQVFHQIEEPLWACLFSPFPPMVPTAQLLWRLHSAGLEGYHPLDFARLAVSSVRDFGQDYFHGEPLRRLLCTFALHSDLAPEASTSSIYACVLAWAAQTYGFPVAEGGAGSLTRALVDCLVSYGGQVRCDSRVTKVVIRNRRARGVQFADGLEVKAKHAVIADTSAPALFQDLVGLEHLPTTFARRSRRFHWGKGVFKMDWTLKGNVPWQSDVAQQAATIHLGDSVDDMSRYVNEVARNLVPRHPYLLLGQPCIADPSRAPDGMTTLWGYTHVPTHPVGDADDSLSGDWSIISEGFADRLEERIEILAPGFRDKILARHIMTPQDLEAANANLVGGDINGGTADLSQQLIFRPLPGTTRYRTPIRGLYLASASTHPGGGVHGAPGAAAFHTARTDLRLHRI